MSKHVYIFLFSSVVLTGSEIYFFVRMIMLRTK